MKILILLYGSENREGNIKRFDFGYAVFIFYFPYKRNGKDLKQCKKTTATKKVTKMKNMIDKPSCSKTIIYNTYSFISTER